MPACRTMPVFYGIVFLTMRLSQETLSLNVHEVLKALSNPARLSIVQKLKQPKKHFPVADQLVDADEVGVCVSIIQETAGLSQSTISVYMATLHRAGLVDSTRVGPWTYYKRNEANIQRFMHEFGEQI